MKMSRMDKEQIGLSHLRNAARPAIILMTILMIIIVLLDLTADSSKSIFFSIPSDFEPINDDMVSSFESNLLFRLSEF